MKGLRWHCLLVAVLTTVVLPAQQPEGRKRVEILAADFMKSLSIGERTGNRLIGHVQLLHNEALMTCDSAYFYSSNNIDAFGHVHIIKNSTHLYGDTLYYDGDQSLARVRGKLVRLEDSSAILRTFNLDYDTKNNVGYFFGDGTLADKENVLESKKGYYYSDLKLAKFHGAVEMHNDTYDIQSDSLHYYTQTETALFLSYTSIWHKDGYLSCKSGWYDRPRDYFHFAEDAYVLSEKQEMWADSIFYNRPIGKSDLYRNIQMLDTTRSLLVFGDEAHLLNEEEATVTRNPSIAYYEEKEDERHRVKYDTLFLRADTLKYISMKNPALYPPDTLQSAVDSMQSAAEALHATPVQAADSMQFSVDSMQSAIDSIPDSIASPPDSMLVVLDSIVVAADSVPAVPDTVAMPLDSIPIVLDSIPVSIDSIPMLPDSVQSATEALHATPVQAIDSIPVVLDSISVPLDSIPIVLDSIPVVPDTARCLPSTGLTVLDSLQKDLRRLRSEIPKKMPSPVCSAMFARKPAADSSTTETPPAPVIDSVLQFLYAYRAVKIYRSDGQAVCDSMVFFVNDTLTEMFYNPVLWTENHQISSDKVRFISKDSALHHAEFLGAAFMVSEEDTVHYNQIKGRDMYAYFKNNEIRLMDVIANVQTIFFMDEDSVLVNINFAESVNMKIFIANRKISRVRYISELKNDLHPLEDISREKQRLKGFVWQDALRPKTRYDVCTRTVKPSQRAAVSTIARPTFPITKKIDSIK